VQRLSPARTRNNWPEASAAALVASTATGTNAALSPRPPTPSRLDDWSSVVAC
jgi:hypothetical protein